jgi:hypothetical protein
MTTKRTGEDFATKYERDLLVERIVPNYIISEVSSVEDDQSMVRRSRRSAL